MRKFTYAPGLPGYGTKGVDGSTGLSGISTYFSTFGGDADEAIIDQRVADNKVLTSVDASVPGWPTRVYQTGDLFIDAIGKVWEIDLDATPRFSYTGTQLASTDSLFVQGPASSESPVHQRYTNDFSNQVVIDSVYAQSSPTVGYASNRTVYGINGRNYGNVQYVNFDISSYHPYNLWSNSDQIGDDNMAIALVKVDSQDVWKFGARDESDVVRPIDLYLDFENVFAGNIHGTFLGTIQSPNLYLTGWLRVDGDVSLNSDVVFTTDDKTLKSKDGGSEEQGFNLTIRSGNSGSTVGSDGIDGGNLLVSAGSGGISSYIGGDSGNGGILTIKSGTGGFSSAAGANSGDGGELSLSGGDGAISSNGVGGSGGDAILKGGDGSTGVFGNGRGGDITVIGGRSGVFSIANVGKVYLGRTDTDSSRGQVFVSSGTLDYPGMMMGDSSLGFYSLPALKRISIAEKTSASAGAERFRFDASTFHASGNVIAYSTMPSDIRLKEDIEPLLLSLEKVLNLKGVTYKRKGTDERHIGFIAQEVEQYMPEVIVETNLIGYPDDEIYKTINYTEIIPHLAEAIKKQYEIIESQQRKIDKLETEMTVIKNKLQL